jgi:hypothetical protein
LLTIAVGTAPQEIAQVAHVERQSKWSILQVGVQDTIGIKTAVNA